MQVDVKSSVNYFVLLAGVAGIIVIYITFVISKCLFLNFSLKIPNSNLEGKQIVAARGCQPIGRPVGLDAGPWLNIYRLQLNDKMSLFWKDYYVARCIVT
jgi:hypothetical protein